MPNLDFAEASFKEGFSKPKIFAGHDESPKCTPLPLL